MSLLKAPLFINGAYRPASDGTTFDVRNPLTNEVVTTASAASSDDCRLAVESAAQAFKTWEHTPLSTKRAVFQKAAELLITPKYQALILEAVTRETAATKDLALALNVHSSAVKANEAAAATSLLKGESFPSMLPGGQCFVQRRAYVAFIRDVVADGQLTECYKHGVVLCICPWNAPVTLAMRSIGVAIACGNTVVLKTSEISPASQSIVAQVLEEAGLPPGVLNVVHIAKEDAPRLTAELIAHPLVRKVTFTGSTNVGRIIACEAAKYLKPCILELGGKAPAVVFGDANLEQAARAIVSGAMLHSGQICMSTERVIVERTVADQFLIQLHMVASQLHAGSTDRLSSVFTEVSAASIVRRLQDAVKEGARVVLGDMTHVGAVVQPHILADVKPGMAAWDEESFGPVIVLTTFNTLSEAVELANANTYSLTASIWTENLYNGLEVARQMRFGATMLNGSTVHTEAMWDHGGLGGSTGYGRFDVDNFTDKRLVVVCPKEGRTYPLTG
ncbi:aldehyde dehydrogenase [Exidia glandulosa HHB12029]|uniref:Aldehyde dehydrogenase n=1 Tax=Exidia glandulosa HHB12029 TaxID=1314781 RepID=A0A165NJB3_EXIGL|nr:aldehyde dehydrogenase [Exidia glandulosa HHB12029]